MTIVLKKDDENKKRRKNITINKQIKKLSNLSFGVIKNEEAEIDKFCNNDSCEVPSLTGDNDDQDYTNG